MRRSSFRPVLVLMVWIATMSLIGCNNSSTMVEPFGSDAAADVQAGMEIVVVSVPSADALVEAVASMITEACAETFDLDNGITGTCSVANTGEATFVFDGVIDANGSDVSADGTLIVNHAADQPAVGVEHEVDFSAATTGPRGDATWSSAGSLTLNETGEVVEFALTLSGTVAPIEGPAASVSVVVDPAQLELIVVGPRGGILRFAMERTAMMGLVTLNGIQVAAMSIVNGCAVLDAVVSELENQTVCP